MLKIVLLGRPGAGKGTQGKRISEAFNIPLLVMRNILEAEIRKGTELGEEIRGYMSEGKLVPDDIIFEVLRKELSSLDSFVLDGFPRTVKQAMWLDQEFPGGITAALYLDVEEINVLRRIMGRLRCKRCGRYYNVFFNPPKDVRRCECGGELYQREDDRYEVIIERLNVFNEETFPVIEYYERQNKLIRVDANENDIGAVWRRVKEAVEGLISYQ